MNAPEERILSGEVTCKLRSEEEVEANSARRQGGDTKRMFRKRGPQVQGPVVGGATGGRRG